MLTSILTTLLPIAVAQQPAPIVGGQRTSSFEAVGALVAVNSTGSGTNFCSATLIESDWAVTAAHCTNGLSDLADHGLDRIYLVFGTDVTSANGLFEATPVDQFTVHPDYRDGRSDHDIALVRLANPVQTVRPVPLNSDAPDKSWQGTDITYVGWGLAGDNAPSSSGVKRSVDVPFLSATDQHIFTYAEDGRNACFGDSGGAALAEFDEELRLVGATSFVTDLNGGEPSCEGGAAAAAATRIDSHLDWIEDTLWGVTTPGSDNAGSPGSDSSSEGLPSKNTSSRGGGCSTAPAIPSLAWLIALPLTIRRRKQM